MIRIYGVFKIVGLAIGLLIILSILREKRCIKRHTGDDDFVSRVPEARRKEIGQFTFYVVRKE